MFTKLGTTLVLLCGALHIGPAFAQSYPEKPVKLLIGWAAGGPIDVAARLFADVMAASLGQPVVIENRPGASGQISHEVLKASAPDGYSIEIYTLPSVVGALLAQKPVSTAELTPIALHYDAPGGVLVNPAAPLMANVQTLKDLIAVAKANVGMINYTSAGTGTTGHLLGAWLGIAEGLKWQHIAYKGVAPASVDLMAGRVPIMFGAASNEQQLIKDGRLRVLSTSGTIRLSRYPGVPSLVESGYGQFSVSSWGGFIAPAGTSRVVVDRVAASVRALFDRPDLVAKLAVHNPEPRFQPAEVLERRMKEDIENFSRIIRDAGIKVD